MLSARGRLLVATPDLQDPNFFRTVILVLEHTDDGALGVVLNRPSGTAVREVLPEWDFLSAAPPVVFLGGPVQPDAVIGLGRVRQGSSASDEESSGVRPLFESFVTLDLEAPPDLATLEVMRVFVGYAGWAPAQLDGELELGGWLLVDAQPEDPFLADPRLLWQAVLRRQEGRLAVFAHCPEDPSTN